jgi:hypothetical protein
MKPPVRLLATTAAAAALLSACFSSSGGNDAGSASFDGGVDGTTFDSGSSSGADTGSSSGADSSSGAMDSSSGAMDSSSGATDTGSSSGADSGSGSGADSGHDGGADSALAPDGDAATTPDAAACDGGAGAVDQTSLVFAGCAGSDSTNLLGQLSIGNCNAAPPAGTSYRVDVYDSTAKLVASASLPTSVFGTACSPPQLSPAVVGPGYFDLSAACLAVTAGATMSFTLNQVGFPAGVCSPLTSKCTSGTIGAICTTNVGCEYQTCTDESTSPSYAGGTMTLNGVAQMNDLDFKTFVQ